MKPQKSTCVIKNPQMTRTAIVTYCGQPYRLHTSYMLAEQLASYSKEEFATLCPECAKDPEVAMYLLKKTSL